jgi:hypothetical protein
MQLTLVATHVLLYHTTLLLIGTSQQDYCGQRSVPQLTAAAGRGSSTSSGLGNRRHQQQQLLQ